MKIVTIEFHSRHRQILFWSCVALFILIVALGPFVATAFLANGQGEITAAKNASQASQVAAQNAARAADQAKKAAQAGQKLLEFVASIQTGPQAKAQRDATGWYIAEFQAICAAQPGCKQIPLPPEVAQGIQQGGG